jgi:uncharacterized OB-fold protein
MLKVGDRVYSWDDISEDIETYTVIKGPSHSRQMDRYMVIGTVVELEDAFATIQLVENDDVRVVADIDYVFRRH